MTSKDGHKAFLTERQRLTADQALDVLGRASQRTNTELVAEADGGRLAAAVTCYAFFAAFALGLLAFAVFGFVLDDPAVLRSVERSAAEKLPHLDVRVLRDARNTADHLCTAKAK